MFSSLILGLAMLTAPLHPSLYSASEARELVAERAIAWGADPGTIARVIDCETGRTWRSDLIGRHGELGRGQWLAGGAWYQTRQYRDWGIDVRALYRAGDADAEFWDIDGLAYAFSWQAPAGMRRQWSCY